MGGIASQVQQIVLTRMFFMASHISVFLLGRTSLAAPSSSLHAAPSPDASCWDQDFTEEKCCTGEGGNEDCWDGKRHTYEHCCLGVPYVAPTLPPTFAKQWRVVSLQLVGGWMVHELEFYADPTCAGRKMSRYSGTIESGHRHLYFASYAFDHFVDATEHTFWYSTEHTADAPAYLGLQFVRPVEVLCVKLWHNNLPALPVQLQKHNSTHWLRVADFVADGGEWVTLPLSANNVDSNQEL
eukprot:GEMP01083062.1.p1 GENE.GEMP01083062.1~~GEMP01083062.1.p1  ORF type:complete len:240 (+),score=36.98 GEMP01083062.1:102-821(+)